jgi:hypothetical protein
MNVRAEIRKIITEAFKDEHYVERLYDRFLNQSVITVGFEIPGTVGQYEEVGTYILPENIKAQIVENAKLVEGYNFPKGKSYGIQLAVIPIDKAKVEYFSEDLKIQAKNHTLLFVDRKTESNGNIVYLIVRDNKIITVYFAKNYVPQDATKLKVDGIIKSMDAIRQRKVR